MNSLRPLVVLAILFFTQVVCSCDEEESRINSGVGGDISARIVASAISYNSYGVTAVLNYLATECNDIVDAIDCDGEESSTNKINYTTPNGIISTTYDYTQNCSKTCSPDVVLHYTTTAEHLTKGGYFKTDNDIDLNVDLFGIEEDSPFFYFDGTYTMVGLWEELATKTKVDVELDMEITEDIQVTKSENPNQIRVTAGTMDFVLEAGLANTFVSTDVKGTITYLSELSARIDIEDGSSYMVNLKTGEITEVQNTHFVADDARFVKAFRTYGKTHVELNKDISNQIRFVYDDPACDYRYEYSLTREKNIVEADLLKVAFNGNKGLKYFLTRLLTGFDGAYFRFTGIAEIKVFKDVTLVEKYSSDTAIWELMYFGKRN